MLTLNLKWKVVLAAGVLALAPALCADEEATPAPAPTANSAAQADLGDDNGDYVTEKKGGQTFKYKKKAVYDFEGASIDGNFNKPSGSYISNIKDVKGKTIIRIRENFDNEVLDSKRLVK